MGFIVIGVLLIAMTMGNSLIARLPASASMLYLLVGLGLGPAGLGLLVLDPFQGDRALIERMTEIAVLISLFTAGLKLDLPLRDPRWRIPVRLATVSMAVNVATITALGYGLLGLPLGAAVLLAAILSPTDPVLASDVQVAEQGDRDRLRFGLTGEGGLNDGTAFPFVMLGLGLLHVHDLGAWGWRWWAVDVLWAGAGGLAIGYALGVLVGRAILVLRTRHHEALGADEFLALGLIALAYGVALWLHTYGFLAVFAAGLALRRLQPVAGAAPARTRGPPPDAAVSAEGDPNAEGAQGHEQLMRAVARFNTELEHVAEVAVVLAVGALLTWVQWDWHMLWFVPVLFLLVRPLAVFSGLWRAPVAPSQQRLMAWFGIRGIGSVYYLVYAMGHALEPALARQLLSVTLVVVVASVVLHGISVTPLMERYEKRRKQVRHRVHARKRGP